MSLEYPAGAVLGDTGLWLRDGKQALVDLSTDYTFEIKVYDGNGTKFTKTDNITGAAGSGSEPDGTPNLTIAWDTTGELDLLTAGRDYWLQVKATRTADSKPRIWKVPLTIVPSAP